MASSYRTLDTDILQVRSVFARTPKNAPIPSTHLIYAAGDGSTYWSSIQNVVYPYYRGVQDLSGNIMRPDYSTGILNVSTSGTSVQGIFNTYVDTNTSTLMFSANLPPIGVSEGSVPLVDAVIASNLPNGTYLTPVTGNSTLKFLGVGDIKLSTVATYNATFVSISSFTSAGYSTISGETFALRPLIASTFSTARGLPSFTSSLNSAVWNTGTIAMSTTGRDLYFTSLQVPMENFVKYIDAGTTSSTKMFIDLYPSFLFTSFTGSGIRTKHVSTFIGLSNIDNGVFYLRESVVTHHMVSQNTTAGVSNWFTSPLKMEVNPLTVLSTFAVRPTNLYYNVYHRIIDGIYDGVNIGINSTVAGSLNADYSVSTSNMGFITMFNQAPQF